MRSWCRWPQVRHHRPPWWPAEEAWPPAGPPWARGHARRGWFIRRIVVVLLALAVFSMGAVTLVLWAAAVALRLVPMPAHHAVLWWGASGLVLLVVAGLLVAGRAFRRLASPLGDVMEAAGALADGDYGVRVVERGPPEVRRLAHAFNEMATRLQAHEATRRGLLADIAHELRTPLAVVQGNLEGLLDGVYPRDEAHLSAVLDETRVLSTLIEDLRTLALAETGALVLHREAIDPGTLIQDVVTALQPTAATGRVTMTTACAASVPAVTIDPVRIRQVLTNLLTNALQHTPPEGTIHVACEWRAPSRELVVTIADTGAGIASDDVPHVFDRFYKSKESRGSGLGLAIAKQLVTAHGGEIGVTSEIHNGTAVRFTLPG